MADVSYKKFFDIEAILNEIKEYSPKINEKRFLDAFSFAERAHRGQLRKDETTPYIVHPVEVVKILSRLHADEDTLISALLHDVPEDTKADLHEVKNSFGDKIAFLVDGITKLSKVHYHHNMPERQVESLKKLLLHTAEDLRVVIIKLADRLHNMQTLDNIKDPGKRLRIASESLEIYVPIANLLGIREIKVQMEDICFKHIFPTEYKELTEKLESSNKRRKSATDKFIRAITNTAEENNLEIEISPREKNLYSIYKKICSIGKTIGNIDERIGIRIIVEDILQCYQTLGIVHSKFIPKTDRFKDYIANPKINGYQSLHTTVFGPDGILTEIQIRTKKMDIEAEYGVAADFFNNYKITADLKRSSWIKKALEIEKADQDSENFLEDLKLDILQDRILVYTPKGTAIDLPKGATVIDFAYAIHTEVGHHALKADINGKISPITTTLKTRDVVSVETSRKVSPDLSWLSFTKTNLAKNKILSYFKKISKDKKIKEGHRILQKEFDISGLGLCENINFRKLKPALFKRTDKTVESLDDLFVNIGEGQIPAIDIVKIVRDSYKHAQYMGKGNQVEEKGIKVHIKIEANNRFGLLRDVSEILYKHSTDMYSLKGWASKYEKDAYFTAELLVSDLKTISRIFDELQQIEDIRSVYRVSSKGLFLVKVGTFIVMAIWIFHPFILRFLGKSTFKNNYPLIADILLYGGLFLLLFVVLYLAHILRKYFPLFRQKKLFWIITFSIPVISIITLATEILYFKLHLSWLVILIELLLIYGYLWMNYHNFKKTTAKT